MCINIYICIYIYIYIHIYTYIYIYLPYPNNILAHLKDIKLYPLKKLYIYQISSKKL